MTNHADAIHRLQNEVNDLRSYAELARHHARMILGQQHHGHKCDKQRKAAADALEAVWSEATAAAYGAAADIADHYADADYCAMGYPEEGGIAASGTADTIRRDIRTLTPQSARDWLAEHDAEVYRRGQEDMRERAAEVAYQWWDDDDSQELRDIIRALAIKEKDDE